MNDKSTSGGEPMTTDATEEAARSVADWAERKSKGRRPGETTPGLRRRHAREMEKFMTSKDWTSAAPRHLVALYAWCHNKVYGLPAPELEDGFTYTRACAAAKRLVEKDFSGSLGAAIAFVRWTWQREQWVENKRKEEGSGAGGFRITWGYQFGAKMVTSYKLDQARKKGL